MTPLEMVLEKLPDARRSGSGWAAKCPAHDDRGPSLSISEGDDGRALVHCHARCEPAAIVEALGLKMSDLMPQNGNGHSGPRATPKTAPKLYPTAAAAVAALESRLGKRAATWTYHDAGGEPVGMVVRWNLADGKKDIRPVSKNCKGWFVGGMSEPRPLYCLPDIGDALRVYIPEGEKCVDSLRSVGLKATTSPHGAKSATKADWRPLAGREVVLLPDNDKPGEQYANDVAAILAKLTPAPTVRVLRLPGLPEGGDIFDWLLENADEPHILQERIENMADAAPAWEPATTEIPESTSPTKPAKRFKPFPLDCLPEPVKGFCKAGAEALHCDPVFIILPLLAALGSAIGATRRIRLKKTWAEPAVIWTAVVSESGTTKSPAQDMALEIINRLQRYKLELLPELQEQYARDTALYQADMQTWKTKGRTKGEPPPERPEEPAAERYIVNDTTMEALVDRLHENPRGLLCSVDELSQWFGSFDAYRGGKGGDVAKWLSVHRAGFIIQDRRTGPNKTIYIPHAAVSLCGGIQPKTLKNVLGQEHIENGLLARLLVVRPPREPKTWTEAVVSDETMDSMKRVFGRLLALDFGLNDDEQPAPVDIPLNPEGKAAWIVFYNQHARIQAGTDGALCSAYSKLEGYAARFALIHHLTRWAADDLNIDPGAVDAVSVEAGANMARWFADEAERVYDAFNENDGDRQSRQLVAWIERRGGTATAREVQQGNRRYKTAGDAEAALDGLAKAGWGRWKTETHNGGKGRPVSRFVLLDTKPSTLSTAYTNSEKPEKNTICVDVDSVNTPKNMKTEV